MREERTVGVTDFVFVPEMSEETLCYRGVVVIDGEPVARAMNRGHGAQDRIEALGSAERQVVKDMEEWMEERNRTVTYVWSEESETECVETLSDVVGEIVARMAIAKDFKTRIGRNLIWKSTEDEDGHVRIRPVKGLRKLQKTMSNREIARTHGVALENVEYFVNDFEKTGEISLRFDDENKVVMY